MPRTDTGVWAHIFTHVSNENGAHTFELLLAEVDSQGDDLGTFFMALSSDIGSSTPFTPVGADVFSNYKALGKDP